MSLSAGARLGPYEIAGILGVGGMGEVYRAHDPRTGRDVAIKKVSERFSDRLSREIRAVAAVNHPHVCQLYDVGPDYLVMELCEGETLADRLMRGKLAMPDAIRYGSQIADALAAAHAKGIVHRDLKPGNIILTPGGVKVLDFGLAKIAHPVEGGAQSDTITAEKTILGTVQYMSPEQAQGKEADARSDIFSFGLVFYEMICGKRAFTGSSTISIIAAILEREAPVLEPEGLNRIVQACLQKDPANRFQSARDLRLALDWSVTGIATAGPVVASGRRAWLPWAVAGTLAILLVSVGFAAFRGTSQPATPLHFQIESPRNSRLLLNLSPDGRSIAFIADGRLWIHSLETGESRDLTVPAAGVPFWSPDGRFVGFPSEGKLRKIDAAGGPPQTVMNRGERSVWGGGAWNQHGDILIGDRLEGLFRVPASGGTPVPVVTLKAVKNSNSVFCPAFLPDGKHFLYVLGSTEEGRSAIYIGSIDAKPEEQSTTPLLDSNSQPAYAPAWDGGGGHVIFVRGGLLMAQPFDDKRLTLTGEARAITAKAISPRLAGAIYVPFSASATNILAFPHGGAVERQLLWYRRDGRLSGTGGEPGLFGYFSISPDGSRIVVSRNNGTADASNIWLLESSTGRMAARFTSGPWIDNVPVWSPDGRQIVFSSNRDGVYDLYRKSVFEGGNGEVLLRSKENKYASSWSSDGRYLFYTAIHPQTKSDIWVLPLAGARIPVPFLVTQASEGEARLSPDGRWVAYQSDETGHNEIYLRSVRFNSEGTAVEAGPSVPVSTGAGTNPRWRGDSRELVYRGGDGLLVSVEISVGPTVRVGESKRLEIPAGDSWDYTPDGKQVLVVGNPNGPQTYNLILNWQAALKK